MPVFAPRGKGDDTKFAYGRHTTVTAVDVLATELKVVYACGACFETDPADNGMNVSAVPGLTSGNITIKTWRNTSGTDPTPIAADAFSKLINWWAIGV